MYIYFIFAYAQLSRYKGDIMPGTVRRIIGAQRLDDKKDTFLSSFSSPRFIARTSHLCRGVQKASDYDPAVP